MPQRSILDRALGPGSTESAVEGTGVANALADAAGAGAGVGVEGFRHAVSDNATRSER
jgi:hypothetical protein